jgi:tetratricopeptide (TPR) repeat protein
LPAAEPPRPRSALSNYVPDEREATVKIEALGEQQAPDGAAKLAFHRRVAARLLQDHAADRAFSELMHGVQELPIDGAFAADLVTVSRVAGLEVAAAAGLEHALPRAEPKYRPEIRRRLARLYRRLGRRAEAKEHLRQALSDDPRDVRAHRQLCKLACEDGDFALAAEQLAALIDEATRRARFRRAARDALARAQIFEEKLGDPLAAGEAYQQAADHANSNRDVPAAFSARILCARALAAGKAPAKRIEAALRELADCGRQARREPEAAAIAAEVARSSEGGAKTLALLGEAAQARGAFQEATALLRAAMEADPADAALALRLESHFIGRGAWEDLAALYRERAAREPNAQVKADLLHRLAELLEDELSDRAGAAEVYADIVSITGDPAALSAQVGLLSASTDPEAVQAALDAAVHAAREPRAKAEALLLRGEVHLGARRLDRAAADFEAALATAPGSLRALAGLAECKADRGGIERLAAAVKGLARGASNRVTLMRRLARLLEWPLGEEERAREAWEEVLAECPTDSEAEGRLIELTRQMDDQGGLVRLLRRRLAREPRGVAARQARHELAQCLERMSRDEEALEEWRMAARMEPGDAVALVALADRCEVRGRLSEAAFALEGAAAATEHGPERAALWRRLGLLCRDRLADPARAAVCEERARQLMGGQLPPPAPPVVETRAPPPNPPPAAEPTPVSGPEEVPDPPEPAAAVVRSKPTLDLRPSRAPTPEPKANKQSSEAIEIKTGDILAIPEEPTPSGAVPASPDRHETAENPLTPLTPLTGEPAAPEPPKAAAAPVARPATKSRRGLSGEMPERSGSLSREARERPKSKPPRKRPSEEPRLRARIDEDPFDAPAYHALAELCEKNRDTDRASLMEEIARALEGDPFAEPLPPRFTLTATDWTALRHPDLRGAAGELFTIVGPAFCSVDALPPKESGIRRAFSMEESEGARLTAEALLCAVRVLGMRSPDVGVGAVESPPLRAVNTNPPQMLVGRSAITRKLPAGQLRFFAGRALVTFKPEMLALRLMPIERVEECLDGLEEILDDVRPLSIDARALGKRLPEKAFDRIGQFISTMHRRNVTVDRLNEGARHTANRAGLLVAGGVAPAVSALHAKRDSEDELAEVLRFAASDRYMVLRGRRGGSR